MATTENDNTKLYYCNKYRAWYIRIMSTIYRVYIEDDFTLEYGRKNRRGNLPIGVVEVPIEFFF